MEPTTSDPSASSEESRGGGTVETDAFVIALHGDIDLARRQELLGLVSDFRRSSARDLVVDLTAVDFMDSTGLGALFRLRRVTLGRGGRLRLVGAARPVRRAMDVSGLTALCEVEDA
jgi:anti-sigma B factor antagonist